LNVDLKYDEEYIIGAGSNHQVQELISLCGTLSLQFRYTSFYQLDRFWKYMGQKLMPFGTTSMVQHSALRKLGQRSSTSIFFWSNREHLHVVRAISSSAAHFHNYAARTPGTLVIARRFSWSSVDRFLGHTKAWQIREEFITASYCRNSGLQRIQKAESFS